NVARSRWSGFLFSSRRRHTRSDRDWSSDVCSSDLAAAEDYSRVLEVRWNQEILARASSPRQQHREDREKRSRIQVRLPFFAWAKIGRASCRERVEFWVVVGSLNKKARRTRNPSHV